MNTIVECVRISNQRTYFYINCLGIENDFR